MDETKADQADSQAKVAGFLVDVDRAYDPRTHLWVLDLGGGHLRLGLDALGVETSGTLAALALAGAGTEIRAGEPFGSMEAAKFVGPLVLPVAGRVCAVNDAVLVDPSLVERDPYEAGWLVEITGAHPDALAGFVSGPEAVAAWFAGAVADYRLKGVLAE